jgi:hypothetical protein
MVENLVSYRWINKGEQVVNLKISEAEKHYKGTYIADLCLKLRNGNWSDEPVSVFWQPKPAQKTHKNYFGLFFQDGKLNICDASSVAEGVWYGMEADDGEVIFSRFRHDYRMSRDKTAMVDGGRDYGRFMGTRPVTLQVIGADFQVVDDNP